MTFSPADHGPAYSSRPNDRLTVWPYAPALHRSRQTLVALAGLPLDLAVQIIYRYSDPGGTVVDPECGPAMPLIAAASLGRRGVGVASDLRWARIALSNVEAGLDPAHRLLAAVRVGPASELAGVLADLTGTVQLIVANLAAGPDGGPGAASRRLGAADLITACVLLRPGGALVVVTGTQSPPDRPPDPGDMIGQRLSAAGLVLRHRVVAHSIGRLPRAGRPRGGSELAGLGMAAIQHSLLVFARRGGPNG